jgi:hypothetical protein
MGEREYECRHRPAHVGAPEEIEDARHEQAPADDEGGRRHHHEDQHREPRERGEPRLGGREVDHVARSLRNRSEKLLAGALEGRLRRILRGV